MGYLVQQLNGSNTTYGAGYTGNYAGTKKLYVKTASNGTLTYPLTTDTSASQYCKFKILVSAGKTAYLAKSWSKTTTTWNNSISRVSTITSTTWRNSMSKSVQTTSFTSYSFRAALNITLIPALSSGYWITSTSSYTTLKTATNSISGTTSERPLLSSMNLTGAYSDTMGTAYINSLSNATTVFTSVKNAYTNNFIFSDIYTSLTRSSGYTYTSTNSVGNSTTLSTTANVTATRSSGYTITSTAAAGTSQNSGTRSIGTSASKYATTSSLSHFNKTLTYTSSHRDNKLACLQSTNRSNGVGAHIGTTIGSTSATMATATVNYYEPPLIEDGGTYTMARTSFTKWINSNSTSGVKVTNGYPANMGGTFNDTVTNSGTFNIGGGGGKVSYKGQKSYRMSASFTKYNNTTSKGKVRFSISERHRFSVSRTTTKWSVSFTRTSTVTQKTWNNSISRASTYTSRTASTWKNSATRISVSKTYYSVTTRETLSSKYTYYAFTMSHTGTISTQSIYTTTSTTKVGTSYSSGTITSGTRSSGYTTTSTATAGTTRSSGTITSGTTHNANI